MRSIQSIRRRAILGTAVAAAVLFLVGAGAARAQEGTVTGQVSDQASLEPLVGAQVFLPGTQLGTLTDDQGHYRITGVPAGSHEVRVRLIGYRSAARNVSVEAGQAVTADFRLSVSAVSLEEVVVTATGTQRQRELGHAVSTIDAASQIQKSESNNLADLIQGNATGVSIRQSSGSVGTGSTIKIRGNSSISLDNTPLIYVDGVRVANDNDVNTVNATLDVGGQRPSRLNDLNPQDIESIDVLKGPSAVTLYGTEAAAGVILITTKKGRQGQTQYNFRAELGGNWDATSWPAMAIDFSSYFGFGKDTIYQSRLFDGEPGIKSPFRTGMQNTYAASVRGGLQGIDYFVSGQYQNLQGNLPSNDVTKWNARGNLSIHPSDKVDISVSNGFVNNGTLLPQNDNNGSGYIGNALLGAAYYTPFDRADPNTGGAAVRTCPVAFELARTGAGPLASLSADNCGSPLFSYSNFADVGVLHTEEDINRYTGSGTVTYRPASIWTNRFTVGLDQYSDYGFYVRPVIPRLANVSQSFLDGFVSRENTNNTNLTLEATSAVNVGITRDLGSTTTLGSQYFDARQKDVYAQGRIFPAGSPAVNNSVETQGNDFFTETKTLGLFGEQQFSWKDRIFVTGGVRFDDNSAFGSELGLKTYPRVSASYILSDEAWFPKVFDQLKLRAAWGESGKQPGTNNALALLSTSSVAIAGQEVLGVTANRPGNDSLKPELDKEIELGFDASILNGRLSGSFTWYDQTTNDAIVLTPLAPSSGYPTVTPSGTSNGKYTNVGEMKNRGIEASIDAIAFDLPDLSWEWRVQASTNYNKVTDLPAPIIYGLGGNTQRHTQGYPFGSYFEKPVLGTGSNLSLGTKEVYLGDPTPNFTGSLASTLTLFNHVTLYGLLDWETGQQLFNGTQQFQCNFISQCADVFQRHPNGQLYQQANAIPFAGLSQAAPFIQDASFAKLRTVSLRVDLPGAWLRPFGAHQASFSVVGNNLMTWTRYAGLDPELNFAAQSNSSRADFLTLPPARSVTAAVSVSF